MKTKQAFWMHYHTHSDQGGSEYIAVIAESLDEAYKKLIDAGIPNEDIRYLNRQIEVLE